MKITVDTTDVLEGVEFRVITPKGGRSPISGWTFLRIYLIEGLLRALLLTLAFVPAVIYIWIVAQFWTVLKAEGVTVWQAGTGLVALYGLLLHWWRTSIQSKLHQLEMKKAYRQDL